MSEIIVVRTISLMENLVCFWSEHPRCILMLDLIIYPLLQRRYTVEQFVLLGHRCCNNINEMDNI